MRGTAGFTLIEALIVVALIGVMAAIAAPAVTAGIDRYTILSAGQQVVSTIRTARVQAVATNMILVVRFDYPDTGQYQIVDASNAAIGGVKTLASGISFSDGTTDVQFTTSGRANATTVVVTNGTADYDRTITVSISGQVKLE
ncbi:MAG: prepilin-type N-terminal cleavage/methylation domain-containing protein [Acidobacteria bacterium]|nr:prepilin-type N-terminal cleavage/methylation domain-containing protein [Acidobacteriota bacterium]